MAWLASRGGAAPGSGRIRFADEGGGEAVETVLGLSVTSSSVGWVLLDGPGIDAATLDHDVFDVSVGSADDGDISKHVAAVRGVQAIAARAATNLSRSALTWTADAAATANLLLNSLPDWGSQGRIGAAFRGRPTWAHEFGEALGFEKAAVCVVEPAAATLLSFGYGAVRTLRDPYAGKRRRPESVAERRIRNRRRWTPSTCSSIGSRGDVELIAGRLSETLRHVGRDIERSTVDRSRGVRRWR